MEWARLLAYITGTVDQELLLRNEYLAAENRILRTQIKGRLLLSKAEKTTLADIGHRLGRKALAEVAATAKPETILGWFRKLVANKFDGSRCRRRLGRPPVEEETEALVVRMAKEKLTWGYDRIVGALANLGHRLSDQTVGNILRRHGIPPAPKRKHTTSWRDFIRAHMDVLVWTDFFTVEVLTLRGLVTYYVLFFIQLESRRVCLAGITPHPDQEWMEQQARYVTMDEWGFLSHSRYLLHDRDGKFSPLFQESDRSGRGHNFATAGEESEFERLRGTLGKVGETGMPIEADLVRGEVSATGTPAIRSALPRGAESPGQREPASVSEAAKSEAERRSSALQRTIGRAAEVL